jgi:hypothetical protein
VIGCEELKNVLFRLRKGYPKKEICGNSEMRDSQTRQSIEPA